MSEEAIFSRATPPLDHVHQRALSAAARAYIATFDDTGPIQKAQLSGLLAGETPEVFRLQNYGFSSLPQPTVVDAAAIFLLGKRALPLLIAVDDRRYRVRGLANGEVCIYDDLGQQVHLTRTGIVVNGAGNPVTITNTPKLHVDGAIEATGEITANVGGADAVNVSQHTHAHGPVPDPGS